MSASHSLSLRGRAARHLLRAAAPVVSMSLLALHARAGVVGSDGTWTGAGATTDWNVAGNWTPVVPGNNSGAAGTNGDTAFFAGVVLPNTVTVDLNRNIKNIVIKDITALPAGSTTAYVIGSTTLNAGNALYLSNGGSISLAASVVPAPNATAIQSSINSTMILTGNSYSFVNNSSLDNLGAASTLGGISPMGDIIAAAAGLTTITLDGTHGTQASSRSEMVSQITDGTGGGRVSIVKNGPGTWEMNAGAARPNTYSGDTIINNGTLRSTPAGTADGLGGFSPNSNYIINSGGVLRNSVAGGTVKSVTINNGGSLSVSTSSSTTLNFATNSGPALHFNQITTGAGTFLASLPVNLTGTVPMQGGIKVSPAAGTSIEIGPSTGTFSLGNVTRVFDVGSADSVNGFDLRIRSQVVGGANAGLVKTGNGTLRFDLAGLGIAGPIDVQAGTVLFNTSNALTTPQALTISGGALAIKNGATDSEQTFSTVTVTSGAINGSGNLSTIRADSFAFNVGTGNTASASAILANRGAANATLTKTGAGTATLTGGNTYTGLTTVNGGTLRVDTNSEDILLASPGAGVNITRGRLVFDYTGGTTPAATLVPILQAGFASNFTSPALQIRSTAGTANLVLGYRDDATAMTFTIAYTRQGDANLDNSVTIQDFALLAANFGQTGRAFSQGNFNYDNVVNINDFALLAANFGQSTPIAADLPRGAAVPEPAAAGLIIAAAGLMARKRRRSTAGTRK